VTHASRTCPVDAIHGENHAPESEQSFVRHNAAYYGQAGKGGAQARRAARDAGHARVLRSAPAARDPRRPRAHRACAPGVTVVDEGFVGRPGIAAFDPLRIVLDVRGTGCTGYEVAAALRQAYDVQAELATQATVVFLVGIAESPVGLERLTGDTEEVVKRILREGTIPAVLASPASLEQQMEVAPRDAFLGPGEIVAVDAAVGQISCESIAGYPPGISAVLPGERITAETVAYLRDLVQAGGRLQRRWRPVLRADHRPRAVTAC
jgi:lysine decarboxylase